MKWEAWTGPPLSFGPQMAYDFPSVGQVIVSEKCDQQIELEQIVQQVEYFDEEERDEQPALLQCRSQWRQRRHRRRWRRRWIRRLAFIVARLLSIVPRSAYQEMNLFQNFPQYGPTVRMTGTQLAQSSDALHQLAQ